jgi:Flp pilus assembly pilin Flp
MERVRKSNKGQTMTEYSLIVLFVGVAAYAAYSGVGLSVKVVTDNLVTFIRTTVAAL